MTARVLWRRGGAVRVEVEVADAAAAGAWVRGVAEALGLTGVDAEAWAEAVLRGGNAIAALKLVRGGAAFREHQTVELTRDVAGLPAGTRGVVAGCYGNRGYEVEVVDTDGATVDVVTMAEADLRAVD